MHDKLWEGLREEFELSDRFNHLELKVGMVQASAQFFLDMIHNQKSDTMEWIIVLLIAVEILICLHDISEFFQERDSFMRRLRHNVDQLADEEMV